MVEWSIIRVQHDSAALELNLHLNKPVNTSLQKTKITSRFENPTSVINSPS